MRLAVSSAVLVVVAACSDQALPQTDNAAVILSQHVASGVYVGDGRVLTNWHVCIAPLFDESLADDDHLRFYNDPGDGSTPYHEGAPLFDAADGRLLGLVWTGTSLGEEDPVVYV